MRKHESKVCPRCGDEFECKTGSIALCQCQTVELNEALIEQARVIGADAVVNVTYESGIGLMTWGYMDAKGAGVKFVD